MPKNVYEIIAISARYFFAGLMVLIVLRAWRLTIVDSRRAKKLRRLSPETGISGELVVLEGDQQARRGMRYPVIREGMIGASRRADVRVRHNSVRLRHAWFQLTPEGLYVRAHAGAPLRDKRGRPVREITLQDGDVLSVGRVRLLLVLSDSTAREDGEGDGEAFDADPDRLFETQPLLNRRGDSLFETDEENW